MLNMITITQVADSLDWPGDTDELPTITIQCAGRGFAEYQAVVESEDTFLEEDDDDDDQEDGEDGAGDGEDTNDEVPAIDLFELSETQLAALNYYEVLQLPYKATLTPDDVKKAYRKASLKYHPDKSGRNEEDDPVFLKVKAAFETLSTQKQAYDSTEMPFDESLPDPQFVTDFYKEYSDVFERNLHFDARILEQHQRRHQNKHGHKKHNKNKRRKSKHQDADDMEPPKLGDESTPIDEVHRFYDYWTHFSTWRDFTIQAAQELETQDHLEQAESRFEKRWYQKEIDKRAKKLKQQEQSRITNLVETAMANDPRLIAENKRLILEKKLRQEQREQEALEKKRLEQEAILQEQQREAEEKERKAQEKLEREKEKKQLRKTKQVFRKHVEDALAKDGKEHGKQSVEDDVELICSELDRDALIKMNQQFKAQSTNPTAILDSVTKRAQEVRKANQEIAESASAAATETATKTKTAPTTSKQNKVPFTKEELSVLAKAVKKYPPGGANRWDQITLYINNVCRPEIPRTKEACIETYNQVAKSGRSNASSATSNGQNAAASASKPAPTSTSDATDTNEDADTWTEEQDKQLQAGLAKFPASMDKNERWTSIAKSVPGKTKKQCVQRFKAIRDAIKNKK